LVEHHLAKVDVESSSLFARSILRERPVVTRDAFFVSRALKRYIGPVELNPDDVKRAIFRGRSKKFHAIFFVLQ
jgi:hypothetical protein